MRIHRPSLMACALIAAALGLLAEAGPVMASWAPPGTGSASSRARTMPVGNTPSASVSGRNVTVSWSASSFSGGDQVSGYTVKRYNTSGVQQTIGSACSGTISALTCTEQGVASGTWKYSVTPQQGNWQGAESAQSAAATVGSPTFSFSGSTTVTSLPATLSGTITNYLTSETLTFRLDNATTGQVLSASITPDPVPSNGQSSVSVTIPSGTSNGSHTVYAVGSGGDVASAAISVQVPISISSTAWNIRDASIGSEQDKTDPFAAAGDSRFQGSGNFGSSFDTNRYYQFDFNSPLASGVSTSSVSFNVSLAAGASNDTACFYFDVRRASTGAVIGTHGDATNTIGCVAGTAQQSFSTALSEVTNSTIANDLRIRMYVKTVRAGTIAFDKANITGSTAADTFTLYEMQYVGNSAGSANPLVVPWGPAFEGDGSLWFYGSATAWPTTFSSSKYLKLTFPNYVPSSASSVSAVTFENSYRGNSSVNTCYYIEVYSGATLIGTHGSSSSPISCNATASYVKDTISLPEVNTVARANGVVIKMYLRTDTAAQSFHDLFRLNLSYLP
jgi:hypothetical protein